MQDRRVHNKSRTWDDVSMNMKGPYVRFHSPVFCATAANHQSKEKERSCRQLS